MELRKKRRICREENVHIMIFGGMQRVSFIDYPGKISAVLFTQGCNYRCFYCHNPELVFPDLFNEAVPFDVIMEFLQSRKGLLDAVVISGGEPTLHDDLPDVIGIIKSKGFLIKLDTNGSNPLMLSTLIKQGLIDFVAMDIKSSFEKYSSVTGITVDVDSIKQSIILIRQSSIRYQFRTTFDGNIIGSNEIDLIKKYLENDSNFVLNRMNKKYIKEKLV